MEVINEKAAMLSNYEVFQLLQETVNQSKGDKSKKRQKHLVNLSTICYEAQKHLEKTPCKSQSPEIIEEFLKAIQPFNLTRAEKLQLLNLRPTTPVEIQLVSFTQLFRYSPSDYLALFFGCWVIPKCTLSIFPIQ